MEHINTDFFYNHQKKYYDALVKKNNDVFHSLVCIPTGGGKTKLAAIYAINNILNCNKKVLWITHSQYLLNQANKEFKKLINDDEWMQKNSILIHSKSNHKADDINSNHKLIIVSFQSLLMCKKDWKSIIGKNTVIIIDEAHHVVAQSYMNLIKDYVTSKVAIGLTATPIRSKANESNELYRFFETDLGVKVHITSLFKEKILVRPIFEDVSFSLDSSEIHSIDDIYAGLLKDADNYNQLILDQYIKNEKKYGKTVIFAINKEHVELLAELFEKKYPGNIYKLYSGIQDREKQFDNFTKSESGILININILNEGVDIPDIQTVFLTKPLNSKIAVTQIIGRALRKSDNKLYANIVNFAVNNLGRKFLIVTPKFSYKLYEAEWNEDDAKVDIIEMEEQNINSLAELVEDTIKKKATCSFSNICLAGHYTIIPDEESDIPIPVSFKEYRKIETYIKCRKAQKKSNFPKKLFFCENIDAIKQLIDLTIDKNNDNGYEIVFTKYDDVLFEEFELILDFVKNLHIKIKQANYTKKEVDKFICEKYHDIQNSNSDLVYYLNQIGINTVSNFINLVRNELVVLKYENMSEE